jgi:hypothetical protein
MRNTSYITLPRSERPGTDNHDNHPNSPIAPVQPCHPAASVDAPQQPHAGDVLLSSDSPTIPDTLSGAGSSQHIIEAIFHDQSTTDARCEPSIPHVHFNSTLPSSASEGIQYRLERDKRFCKPSRLPLDFPMKYVQVQLSS